MLETRLLISNAARSGVCACIAMDFSWKAAGLEILALSASSRNWMCFSGVICGQRVVLSLRSSVSFSWGAPSSPCERNVLLQLPPPCWKEHTVEKQALSVGKVNMGGFMHTQILFSGMLRHFEWVTCQQWWAIRVPSWAQLCLAKDACMPQCTSKCHYGIAQSSGKLGVFLHSFSPSIGLHSDPVQREFLVCRRSCCVALVQMLLGAEGRIVLDPCWPTHGLEQQRHTSFNVKFLLKGKESAFLSSKLVVVYKHHGFVSVHEYLLNCFCCSYNESWNSSHSKGATACL